MRSLIVIAMFTATLAHAGWSDYEEVRDLSLDAKGISQLTINAGAGSLDVTGVAGLDKINVKATIVVPDKDEDKAVRVIEKRIRLSLDRNAGEAELEAWFESGRTWFGSSPYIILEVSVPQGMALNIDDGSGSIDIVDLAGDIIIDDGSGSIDIRNVADVRIDDGSGSIDLVNATGDVSIVDGSGSISVKHVQGSVTIDDGSGSIAVSDIDSDLIIVDDGSGSLRFSDIRGIVDADT
jgi:hypothetical protein